MPGFDTGRWQRQQGAMDLPAEKHPDSPLRRGGTIPGSGGLPAFEISGPRPSAIPVLIAVPHAGRSYPEGLLARLRDPAAVALRLEDRHVDLLGRAVARKTGAMLAVAHAPRAMIDLNRAPDDVDWDMFERVRPEGEDGSPASQRARSGLGLIPRRLPGLGELWKRRHEEADLAQRVAGIHAPYHDCLSATLAAIRARFGVALLLDFHSMPPLPPQAGRRGADFVLGDRFGASCDHRITARALSELSGAGYLAAHNRPYAGGYVLERHAAPARGIHAVQIEIDRSLYLDSHLAEPGQGMRALSRVLAVLVKALADEAAGLAEAPAGGEWPQAAE